jgi:hypothetical protein
VWDRKPVLRLVYEDFYDRIAAVCRAGRTIEIGGGIGNLKRRLTAVVAIDIHLIPHSLDSVLNFGAAFAIQI